MTETLQPTLPDQNDLHRKRSLTEDEIRQILSFIKPLPRLPEEIGKSIAKQHFDDHAKQLRSIQLYPSQIPAMRARLERAFYKAQIEPGKSIGALASSSIGERVTQSSLSSFHTSGQSKVDLLVGIPRIEEIINATREIKTPCMEVHLNRTTCTLDQLRDLAFVRQKAQELFEYKYMIDFLADYEMLSDRELTESEQVWYSFHRMFYGTEYEACKWSIRLMFDTTRLFTHNKTLLQLAETIQNIYGDAFCVVSPDNIGIIDVYVSTDNLGDVDTIINSIKSTRKKVKKENRDDEDLVMLIDEDNKEYYFIRDLVVPSILYIPVGGIEGVSRCFYQENKDGTWFINTKGSNLKAIIRHPLVDSTRTTSNHLWDTFEVFGIEATKVFYKVELRKLMSVSERHLDLLINGLTQSGRPVAASRYGIDRKQVGVLAKTAFEVPFETFFHSATIAEKEDMTGVSSSITVGNVPLLGSGFFGVLDKENGSLIDNEQLSHKFHQRFQAELDAEKARNEANRGKLSRNNSMAKLPSISENPYEISNAATMRSKPRFLAGPQATSQPSVDVSGTGIRKSVVNTKIKKAAFIPDLPSHAPPSKPASTVTRIVMNSSGSMELVPSGRQSHQVYQPPSRPSQASRPSIFNTPGGKVIESEVEIY